MVQRPASVLHRHLRRHFRCDAVIVHVAAEALRVERRRRGTVGRLELQVAFPGGVGADLVHPDAARLTGHAECVVDDASVQRRRAELQRAERTAAMRADLGTDHRADFQLVQQGLVVLQHHVGLWRAASEQRAHLVPADAGFRHRLARGDRAELQRCLRLGIGLPCHRPAHADDGGGASHDAHDRLIPLWRRNRRPPCGSARSRPR